ncbi:Kazal-type serine protease inhibitor domain protein [Minicystis rosea]|nr:Kazal-type serine protease inhibitor domain protein [Minicystis rosea]
MPITLSALAAFAGLAAACGDVVVDASTSGTTSGSGTGGATTSVGGWDTTTGSGNVTTSVSSVSGTGGGPTVCGGKAGTPCGIHEYCAFDPSVECGGFDATGICQPKPDGCTADCPGVCGCDGKFYCNACSAHQAGVDVSSTISCSSPDAYRAVNMFTNLPRFLILKASPSRNLCFRLQVEPNIGEGWAVSFSEVSNDVHDCDIEPGSPPAPLGETVTGMNLGSGVKLQVSPAGCIAGIHQKIGFAAGSTWAPPVEDFEADGLGVEGGCP